MKYMMYLYNVYYLFGGLVRVGPSLIQTKRICGMVDGVTISTQIEI